MRVAKILVSMDDRLLARLDDEAAARGLSRSALIGRLAAEALGEPVGPGADPDVHAALDRLRQMFVGVNDDMDSVHILREMRDSR